MCLAAPCRNVRQSLRQSDVANDVGSPRIDQPHLVADPNLPILEHVGSQAAAVQERIDERLTDQLFEILAWLAQAHALAEQIADAEAMSEHCVQRNSTGGHVASTFAWLQRDSQAVAQVLEHFGFDESQRTASARRFGEVTAPARVAVAFETNPCKRADSIRRPHWLALALREMDELDAAGLCVIPHAHLNTTELSPATRYLGR